MAATGGFLGSKDAGAEQHGAGGAQDEEDGDEIPDEDEAGVGAAGAAKVVVAVPTDFTLSESCQALMDTLCAVRP